MQKNASVVLLLLLCSTLKWDRQDEEMGDWNDDNHWTSFRRCRQFTNSQKQKHSFPAHSIHFNFIVAAIYTTYTVGLCRISVPKEQQAKKNRKQK